MALVYQLVRLAFGVVAMTFSSDRVIKHGRNIATALQVHPFLIGLTLMSIGTDLPEIMNAVMSSALGHGDINVGDSLGSAITQITLVLGILAFVTDSFKVNKKEILSTGSILILALFFFAWASLDGHIGRLDALLMLALWVASVFFVGYTAELDGIHKSTSEDLWRDLLLLFVSFGGVAIGAYITIRSVIVLSASWGLPEYFVSFVVMGLGTSLPELAVDFTALRRGESEIAVGGLMGSSLVDATVSIASGAILFPISISTGYVFPTTLLAIFATAAVTALLGLMGEVNKVTGALLVLVYIRIIMSSWSFL